jgi:hypothetical protein
MSVPDREADENVVFTGESSCPVGAPPSMKMGYTARGTEPGHTGRSHC